MARDYPKPNVEDTDPYREANALSSRFRNDLKVLNAIFLVKFDEERRSNGHTTPILISRAPVDRKSAIL